MKPSGRSVTRRAISCVLVLCTTSLDLLAQPSDAMRLGVTLTASHRVLPNLTYITASGYEANGRPDGG